MKDVCSIEFVNDIDDDTLQSLYLEKSMQRMKHDDMEMKPIKSDLVHYVGVKSGEKFLGCLILVEVSKWEVELHSMLRPNAILAASKILKKFITSFFERTNVLRITSYIPDYLPKARLFNLKIGANDEGYRADVGFKDGKRFGIYIMGVTRKGWC